MMYATAEDAQDSAACAYAVGVLKQLGDGSAGEAKAIAIHELDTMRAFVKDGDWRRAAHVATGLVALARVANMNLSGPR